MNEIGQKFTLASYERATYHDGRAVITFRCNKDGAFFKSTLYPCVVTDKGYSVVFDHPIKENLAVKLLRDGQYYKADELHDRFCREELCGD